MKKTRIVGIPVDIRTGNLRNTSQKGKLLNCLIGKSDTAKPVSILWIFNKTQHPPWSRVLLEKFKDLKLVKKSPEFCGTQRWYTLLPLHFTAHFRLPSIQRITLRQFQKLQEHSLQQHITRRVSRSYLYYRLLHYWGTTQEKNGSVSSRHGASSGCGWRNGLRYGG